MFLYERIGLGAFRIKIFTQTDWRPNFSPPLEFWSCAVLDSFIVGIENLLTGDDVFEHSYLGLSGWGYILVTY